MKDSCRLRLPTDLWFANPQSHDSSNSSGEGSNFIARSIKGVDQLPWINMTSNLWSGKSTVGQHGMQQISIGSSIQNTVKGWLGGPCRRLVFMVDTFARYPYSPGNKLECRNHLLGFYCVGVSHSGIEWSLVMSPNFIFLAPMAYSTVEDTMGMQWTHCSHRKQSNIHNQSFSQWIHCENQ